MNKIQSLFFRALPAFFLGLIVGRVWLQGIWNYIGTGILAVGVALFLKAVLKVRVSSLYAFGILFIVNYLLAFYSLFFSFTSRHSFSLSQSFYQLKLFFGWGTAGFVLLIPIGLLYWLLDYWMVKKA